MSISPSELARRLEEAARARLLLRRATHELRAMGEHILEERRRANENARPPATATGRGGGDLGP